MKIDIIGSGSKGNCYRIDDGQTALLIECGLPFKKIQQKLDFELYKLSGCLISHEHGDHAKAHKDMAKSGIPIFTTKGTIEALNEKPNYFYRPLKKGKSIFYDPEEIGTFKVTAFKTIHDAAEPVGYILQSEKTGERLVFITDTAYSLINFSEAEIDYFMIEINYQTEVINNNVLNDELNVKLRNRILGSHMNLETALDFLKATRTEYIKRLYVLHLSDRNSNQESILHTLEEEFPGLKIVIC